MWQCSKCGREFKNINQSHYCGKVDTIDAYIAEQAIEIQPILLKIRETIHLNAPNATEKISWQMPTFWQGENLIHFAAHKKHISLYPGEAATSFFAERLTSYAATGASVGTIKLPIDKPIDFDLIADIVRWRVAQVEILYTEMRGCCVERNGSEIIDKNSKSE